MNYYQECPVIGFVDETGNFAFRFDELDAFAGKLVVDVTGFYNGTCMVAGRQDDGVQTAVEGDNVEGRYEGIDLEFFYEIDKTGAILREVTYDDYVAFRQKILPALGIRDPELGNYALYHTDSIQLADGLTLSVDNPLSATEVIPGRGSGRVHAAGLQRHRLSAGRLPDPRHLRGGRRIVLMECTDAVEAATAESAYQAEQCTAWYKLNYTWIAPDGYRVPDGTQKNLSAQGWKTCGTMKPRSSMFRLPCWTPATSMTLCSPSPVRTLPAAIPCRKNVTRKACGDGPWTWGSGRPFSGGSDHYRPVERQPGKSPPWRV